MRKDCPLRLRQWLLVGNSLVVAPNYLMRRDLLLLQVVLADCQ